MSQTRTSNQRIVRNTVFLYVRMILVLAITLYTTRLLLNALGESDYGIYNIVSGVVTMFAFLNASFTASIQRFYNYEHGINGNDGVNKVFNASCRIQIIIAIIIAVLLETVGRWYMHNYLVVPPDRFNASLILFHCTVLSLLFVIFQIPFSSAIMSYEKMDYYAYVSVIDVVLKLIIAAIIKFYCGDKLILYGILLLAVSVIDFILYYLYVRIKLSWLRIGRSEYSNLFYSMFKFAGWSVLGSFAMVMRNQGLSMILNLFGGPIINAARGISYQIKGGLVGFINNISTATRPQIVEAYSQDNFSRATSLTFSTSKICFYLLYVMALPVSYEMNYILKLWLGSSIPEYTVMFSILILVIALIDGFNPPLTTIIYATGKNAIYNVLTSLAGLLVLPMAYIVLKLGYSPIAVYVSSIIISILVYIVSVLCLQRQTEINALQYVKKVTLPCISVLLITILIPLPIVLYLNESFFRLLIVTVLSLISVGIASYYIGLEKDERQIINSYIKRLLKKN